MKVLVAYETIHGSTRSIAENIARALGEVAVVTIHPMRNIDSLDNFDAFVLGGAEVNGAWTTKACEFLLQHGPELADKPVWLFGVGNSDALPRPLRRHRRRRELVQLNKCAAAAIHPQDAQVFSGLIASDQHHPNQVVRRLTTHIWPRYGDFRDWTRIMSWAEDISAALRPTTS